MAQGVAIAFPEMGGLKASNRTPQPAARAVAIAFPEMGGLKVVIYQDPESNSNVAIAFPEMGWLKEAGLAFRSKGMGRYNLIPIDV